MIQTNYEVFHFCSWNEAVFVATSFWAVKQVLAVRGQLCACMIIEWIIAR